MVWNKDIFLEVIGLAPQDHKPYKKQKIHIDKGEIDPRTMGGVAVISDCKMDSGGLPQELNLKYWVIHPDGRYEQQNLIQMEIENLPGSKIDIKNLWVLGRQVNLQNISDVHSVLEAVRLIHVDLRDTNPEIPNIAKIFKDCEIEASLGEALPLPGFHPDHRIYFPITQTFNNAARGRGRKELLLPQEAFFPLSGMRRNTLDQDHSYIGRDFLKARYFDKKAERHFETKSELKASHAQHFNKAHSFARLEVTQNSVEDHLANTKHMTAQLKWRLKRHKDGENAFNVVDIKHFSMLGTNILGKGFKETMSGLGVLNKAHTDMLNSRDYPNVLDHMATYGLLETAHSSANPPTEKTGRFTYESKGGNNLREIVPGIGEDIGGNCKIVKTEWVDTRTKEVKRLGAILDVGSYLMKSKSDWDAGHPDVVEDLKHCHDIFITHHHLDHLDGLIPYIQRGLIGKQHRLYMTPEVHEVLDKKLSQWNIKKDDKRRPKINLLQGTGVIDLNDDKGICRMSVAYGVDAVPHSAKDTPFIAYGRNGNDILGSVMYMGDMRYDEEFFENHDCKFWDPVELMLQHNPDLNSEHCIPTYVELDGTSMKHEGKSARETELRENLSALINHCSEGRDVGIAIIGTNDGRRESLLDVATRTQRNITAFGSAVEKLFGIANKWGVNPYKIERPQSAKTILSQIDKGISPYMIPTPATSTYTGIADFLNYCAVKLNLPAVEHASRTSNKVKNWFNSKERGKFMAVLSGSQGHPIEFESMTYKMAEGRSYFDADANHSKTARPADLKGMDLYFSQGAIPGNAKYQNALIKRLAGRGATVYQAIGDDIRIHNPNKQKDKILDFFVQKNLLRADQIKDAIETDGSIYIKNYSIHPSGHGKKEDARLWLRHKLKARYFGLHHTDDRACERAAYDLFEDEGLQHIGGMFENGEIVEITNDNIKAIGNTTPSVVMTKEEFEDGKPYNKQMKAVRYFNYDDRATHHKIGLRGTIGGIHEVTFGVVATEDLRRQQATRAKKNEKDSAPLKTKPIDERLYRSPNKIVAPDWDADHPALQELG